MIEKEKLLDFQISMQSMNKKLEQYFVQILNILTEIEKCHPELQIKIEKIYKLLVKIAKSHTEELKMVAFLQKQVTEEIKKDFGELELKKLEKLTDKNLPFA